MGLTLIKRELKVLNHIVAAEFLKFNNYVGQRPLTTHVKILENEINNNNFMSACIKFAILDNRKFLINGQHTCHAVVNTCGSVDIIYEEYLCKTKEELSDLFLKIDREKPRLLKDRVRMEMQALELNLNPDIITLITSTIPHKEGKRSVKLDDKIKKIKDYVIIGKIINDILYPKPTRYWKQEVSHMFKVPVIHAMMLTLEKNEADAIDFWIKIRDGENLSKDQAEYKLREYLKNTNANRSSADKESASYKEITYRCIVGWNAVRQKKPTSLRYNKDKNLPTLK